MADPQGRAQAILDDLVGRDVERGLQVAAYYRGELVVDAWAGVADSATGRPVDGDTLFTVFSCGKGITATVVHLLAERGKLDYDDPVARHWPAFAVHGKAKVTIRQVMSHTAGVPQMPDGSVPEDLCDWGRMCARVADLELLWEPGTRIGYHARTYGYILGEVVRRIDGRTFDRIVEEDIAGPLGIDSMFFGIPDDVEPRVANQEQGPALAGAAPPPPESLALRAIPPSVPAGPSVFNRADVRRACIPSSGGIMNARALARHYAALVEGELDGVRLLSPERLRLATTLQAEGMDLVTNTVARRALGYSLGGRLSPMGNRATAFGHSGSGGALGFGDPEYRFAFALTKTRMVVSEPLKGAADVLAREIRLELGIPSQ